MFLQYAGNKQDCMASLSRRPQSINLGAVSKHHNNFNTVGTLAIMNSMSHSTEIEEFQF
jgi:hypothetical protein